MAASYDDEFVVLGQEDVIDGEVNKSLPPRPETVQQILDWLQPTAYDDGTSEYLRHLMSHVQGTGDWLPATEEYQQWHSSSEIHTLWVKAVPGAGKSVLAAHQRARLSTTEKAPVLHFFFRQIITSNRTPTQLVRDWLAQILPRSVSLQRRIEKDILEKNKTLSMVAFQDLWDMFQDTVKELPRVYCFADALDEMSVGHDDFLVKLTELGNSGNCKVFLTSRPVPRIVEVLRKQPVIQITLDPENMDGDISIYIDHRLERDIDRYIQHRLRTSGIDLGNDDSRAAIEPLVRSTLQSKAQGSFLYARLMMDNVLQAISKVGGDVNPVWMQRVLDDLPTGLSEMYGDMLRDHASRSGTSPKLQRTILQWVTHAERPLRMLELAAVVDFESGTLERNKDTKAIVRTGCGPLLEILPSDVVGPVHHSFTEYLTSKLDRSSDTRQRFLRFENKPTHRIIAEQCIKYIMHVFHDSADKPTSAMKLEFPFLDYALQSWPAHVSKCGSLDPEMIQLLEDLVVENKAARRIWANRKRNVHEGGRRHGFSPTEISAQDLSASNEDRITPVHIAASVGIATFIPHLKALGYDLDVADARKRTAVHFAARDGNTEALETLIQLGANLNPIDDCGHSPLHLAATNGNTEAVEALLRRGVDPMIPTTRETLGNPPVKDAAEAGHVQTTVAFLKYLDVKDISLAMHYALTARRQDVAIAILQDPRFKINRKVEGKVPIFTAAENRDLKLIKLFLDAGASVSVLSLFGSHFAYEGRDSTRYEIFTPLYAYVKSVTEYHGRDAKNPSADECSEAIKLLVDAGCPLEAKDRLGSTVLCDAQADYLLSSILIANGASLEPVLSGGNYPLHQNAGRDMDAMKLWIKHGFDLNGLNADGLTPLHVAADRRTDDVGERIKVLLELGADPNVASRTGDTVLHRAHLASLDYEPHPVKVLIDAGADVNARDARGMKPFMRCKGSEIAAFGQLYIDAGVDINTRDSNGDTWLSKLFSESFHYLDDSIWKLPFDIDFKVCDAQGANLIHHYVSRNWQGNTLNELIDRGVDPHALDAAGNTALHYAVQYDFAFFQPSRMTNHAARKLIEIGVDATKVNHRGQSVFFFAVAVGHPAMDFLAAECDGSFDVNQADFGGITPLHVAVTFSDNRTMRLLEKGADVFARTRSGQSVLHAAALADKPENLAILLSWIARCKSDRTRALVNTQDEGGATALHYAAQSGRAESVKALLDAGAMPELQDRQGYSALARCASFPKEREMYQEPRRPRSAGLVTRTLAQDWEEMVRRLSHRDQFDQTRRQNLNIRQCVRYLCAAGAKICDPKGRSTNDLEQHPPAQHVLDAALRSKCEPMISELMKQMKSRNEEAGYRPSETGEFALELELAKYENHEKFLESLVESELDEVRRFRLMQELIQNDSSEQILSMCRKGYDFFQKPKDINGIPSIVQLVKNGSHEALQLLRPLLNNLQPCSSIASRATSIYGPFISNPDLRGYEKDWKLAIEALDGPMDGLLLEVCNSVSTKMETVKLIVEHYGCSRHEMTMALFHMAGQSNWWHLEAVGYFLDQGLDVNFRFSHGLSPLRMACRKQGLFHHQVGHYKYEMVTLLLSRGADPNVVDEDGRTCLNDAIQDSKTFKTLLQHGADPQLGTNPPIIEAITLSDVDLVGLIIEQGVDLNRLGTLPAPLQKCPAQVSLRGRKQWDRAADRRELRASYPLHFAICNHKSYLMDGTGREGQKEKLLAVIKLLSDGGADPFAIVRNGLSVIHDSLARTENAEALLDILGLDLESRDSQGRTLLLARCCNHGQLKSRLTQQLLDLGSDVTAVDSQNRNFLHRLLMGPEFPAFRRLEELCGELFSMERVRKLIDSRDNAGFTPVQCALANTSWTVVRLLMEHGADISSPDPNGENALHHILGRVSRIFSNGLRDLIGELRQAATRCNGYSSDEDTEDALATNGDAEYNELKSRVEEQTATEILAAVNVCKSAGNDINALSSSRMCEPPVFGYLRSCPTWTEGKNCETDGEKSRFAARLGLLVKEAGVDLKIRAGNGQCGLHILANCSPARDVKDDTRGLRKKLEEPLRDAWKMLIDAGLDPYLEDNEQRSALDIAAAAGNTTIMEMF